MNKDLALENENGGPIIAIPFLLIKKLRGDLGAAAFLTQAKFFSKLSHAKEGWFDFTQTGLGDDASGSIFGRMGSWESLLGLSPDRQLAIRKKLKNMGVLGEKQKGIPNRLHYRVDPNVYDNFLTGEQVNTPVPGKSGNKPPGKPETAFSETPKPAARKSVCKLPSKSGSNPESFQRVTKKLSMHAVQAEKNSVESTQKSRSSHQSKDMVQVHGVEVWDPHDAETVARLLQEFGANIVAEEAKKIAGAGYRPYPSIVQKNLKGLVNENRKSNYTNNQNRRQSKGQGHGRLSPIDQLLADHSDKRNEFGGRDYEVVEG